MEITFNWTNRNTGEDGTRIYRSESSFDEQSLPETVHDTLPPGADEYTDTTVTRGVTYYYMTEVFKGGESAFSKEIVVLAQPRTGPGPQVPLYGDYELGYFGTLTSYEMFNSAELEHYMEYAEGSRRFNTPNWFKFAYKGKILFIPQQPLRDHVSWKGLYEAGLVYGTNDNGHIVPAGVTPTNQQKRMVKNGEEFIVRLMRGSNVDVPNFTLDADREAIGLIGSEWNDLMYRVVSPVLSEQRGGNWVGHNVSSFGGTYYGMTMCQELDATESKPFYRGPDSTTNNEEFGFAGHGTALDAVQVNTGNGLADSNHVYNGWRPVLEYVPNKPLAIV